ncbi:hypothetical protein MesoLjLa_26540 [Mesorhizobium sp. L-2-11]|nr:hypothetical protein MesoLjLa_26540 [Mesorhizobium sp. L-2-11]
MYPNPKLDAAVLGHAGVALDHAILHFYGAAHGIYHTAEFDQRTIACALDHSTVVNGDGRVNQVAAKCPQPGQSTIFIRARQPAVPDHISGKDRG